MLVANSFDLWQKDAFFSAAEEVQQSADIMESAYRTWVKERREGLRARDLDELCRELQTALGTAKWQLEEFERAVRMSYRSHSDDITTARHTQFVAAIENQISRVEAAVKESFYEEGKQPFRWVNLDEEECDSLAAFLSGTLLASQAKQALGNSTNDSFHEAQYKRAADFNINTAYEKDIPNQNGGFEDVVATEKDSKLVIRIEAEEISQTRDDMSCQADRTNGTRRTWSSPDFGAWKIVIADEDEQKKALLQSMDATPKEKGSKSVFSKQRCGDYHLAKRGVLSYTQLRGINWINQILGWFRGYQRQLQSPLHLQIGHSLQFTLALMLTIFLIVPFVLYST
ncbi:uncharacterized protein LOC132278497 [Cornus florida]|uniref:uncharacterized protein LOC132278497 n=1 Tax=Cornus florida TaxID=4283 RepID=UPI0028963D83|nr:uncharacterized protein LOC132278497 [Cornus florida]